MMLKNRRDCIVTSFCFVLTGMTTRPEPPQVIQDASALATQISFFREAVQSLRDITDLEQLNIGILAVKKFGDCLIASGVRSIDVEFSCDMACNHWLKSLQKRKLA